MSKHNKILIHFFPSTIKALDTKENQFGKLLLNLPNLHYILLYLNKEDLHQLYRFMNQYRKLEPLENAAKYAFKFVLATNKEGNQKARQTKILRDQTVYDTPRKIVKLIPNFNSPISETMRKYQTIQIKRLRELRFGPSTPLRFNKFFGRPLLSNYNQDCFNSYTWEPMTCGLATSHAIATTNEKNNVYRKTLRIISIPQLKKHKYLLRRFFLRYWYHATTI